LITSRIPGRRSILSGFDADDWRLASPILGDQLRALADEGFHVVVASNQESIRGALYGPRAAPKVKARVDAFMAVLIAQGVSATVMLATAADDDLGRDEWNCRKPDTGLWDLLAERYNGGVPVDRRASFLVGGDGDVADPNREFAAAIGVADFRAPAAQFAGFEPAPPAPFPPAAPAFDDNAAFVTFLYNVATYYEGVPDFARSSAFHTAVFFFQRTDRAYDPNLLAPGVVPGVGKGVIRRLVQFAATGTCEELQAAAGAAAAAAEVAAEPAPAAPHGAIDSLGE
jgi:DNA 3'-phosphatase